MRILLLGEYSNLHATLAEGLRKLGHDVLVVSDGTNIYNYRRDISLYRKGSGWMATARYGAKLLSTLPRLRGFDIVQLINPDFISLKAERQYAIYNYLRHHNKHIVMGAFGNDWQWVSRNIDDKMMRYSEFYANGHDRTALPQVRKVVDEWYGSEKGRLSQHIANDCDAIVACLYEYQKSYERDYAAKTHFIPLPIVPKENICTSNKDTNKVRLFLGIKRNIMQLKGMDMFEQVLNELKAQYPDKCETTIVEDLPYETYVRRMEKNDVLMDQAFSYTPAMNALEAMSRGLVTVSGGEPENYEVLGERELRPIVNVLPDIDNIHQTIEHLILHPELLPDLKRQGLEYIRRHHDYVEVARRYEKLYHQL